MSCFRGQVLSEPAALAGRLLRERLIEEKHQHAVLELIMDDLCAMLEDLAQLPSQVVDQNGLDSIDEDLAAQVEGISEFRQTPGQAKAATERAKVRREQKDCDDAQAPGGRARQELGPGVKLAPPNPWALASRHMRELIHAPRELVPRSSSSFCQLNGGIETPLLWTVRPVPEPFGRPAPSRRPPHGMG